MRRIPVPIGRADPGQVFLALCQGLIRWRIEPTGIAGARDWHPAECWGAVGARDAGRVSRSDTDITKQKLEHRESLAGPSTMISQVRHFPQRHAPRQTKPRPTAQSTFLPIFSGVCTLADRWRARQEPISFRMFAFWRGAEQLQSSATPPRFTAMPQHPSHYAASIFVT
jgi:hypothetical protein